MSGEITPLDSQGSLRATSDAPAGCRPSARTPRGGPAAWTEGSGSHLVDVCVLKFLLHVLTMILKH